MGSSTLDAYSGMCRMLAAKRCKNATPGGVLSRFSGTIENSPVRFRGALVR